MLQSTSNQTWNKKTGIVTTLVALVGIFSVLYSTSIFLNDQFVSAVVDRVSDSNTFADKIHPWKHENLDIVVSTSTTSQPDVLHSLTSIQNRLSEIDDKILQNIRSGTRDASLFEEKGDLLHELGRYDKAISYYQEALDIDPKSNIISEKLLKTKTSLDRAENISRYYSDGN